MRRMMTTWRLQYGLLWPGRFPPLARTLVLALVTVILTAAAMVITYDRIEADIYQSLISQARDDTARYRKAFLDCLSGGVILFPDTMEALKCHEATHVGRI